MTGAVELSVSHSPDSDDYFFFHALRTGIVTDDTFRFTFHAFPTDELNRRALAGADDVVAVSAAILPQILPRYRVLSGGASIGRGYGPVLVAPKAIPLDALSRAHIAIPGETTTAAYLLKKLLPEARTVEVPISPFHAVFEQLRSGAVQAAVLIHEGQLEYARFGCELLAKLSDWWEEETNGLPLPLGVNVIRRSLGEETVNRVSVLIQRSIDFALDHTPDIVPELIKQNIERDTPFRDPKQIERYLSLYGNEDSRTLKPDVVRALEFMTRKERLDIVFPGQF